MERNSLVAILRDKFTSIIPETSEIEQYKTQFMSTGITPFDVALGGGFPRGHITHIWGPDGAGKTTTMIPAVISAQQNPVVNGLTLYIANEPKVDPTMFFKLGVDPESVIFARTREPGNPLDGNKSIDMIREAIGKVDLIVLDSVAGLSPSVIYNMESEDYTIGKVARLLSDQFPLVANVLAATPTVLVMLNQERASFSQYGKDTKPFAGYAITHWVAVRVYIRKISPWMTEGKKIVGYRTRVTTEKNDFFPPRRETEWNFRFDSGVDPAEVTFISAKDLGVIRFSGGWKIGDTLIGRNKDDAILSIASEPELLQNLKDAVFEAMKCL